MGRVESPFHSGTLDCILPGVVGMLSLSNKAKLVMRLPKDLNKPLEMIGSFLKKGLSLTNGWQARCQDVERSAFRK